MRRVAMGLQVLLALGFLASGAMKLTGGGDAMRDQLQIAGWFWTLTAFVEIVGAGGLLAGLKDARIAVLAGLWLAATMVGALLAHLRVGDEPANALAAAILLVLSLAVAALRWRELGRGGATPERRERSLAA